MQGPAVARPRFWKRVHYGWVALVQDFGWSRGSTASIFSSNMMVAGLSAPLVWYLVDRYGPRRVLPWGAALLGGGLLLCAAISRLWHLWPAFGLLALALLLPLTALCQRDRPEDVGLGPDGAWAARPPGLFSSGHEAGPGEEARLGVVLRLGRFWRLV